MGRDRVVGFCADMASSQHPALNLVHTLLAALPSPVATNNQVHGAAPRLTGTRLVAFSSSRLAMLVAPRHQSCPGAPSLLPEGPLFSFDLQGSGGPLTLQSHSPFAWLRYHCVVTSGALLQEQGFRCRYGTGFSNLLPQRSVACIRTACNLCFRMAQPLPRLSRDLVLFSPRCHRFSSRLRASACRYCKLRPCTFAAYLITASP